MTERWPLYLTGAVFAPLGVVAPKGTVPLLFVAALGVLAMALIRRRQGDRAGTGSPWLWITFAVAAGWAALSIAWTLDPLAGLTTWSRFAAVLLAAFMLCIACRTEDPVQARRLAHIVTGGYVVAALLLIVDQTTGLAARAWYYDTIGRPAAFDPTLLNRPGAIVLLASWPAAMAMHRLGHTRLAVLAPLLAAVCAFAGVSTSNKTAIALALLVAAALWYRRRLAHRILTACLLAGLVAAPLLPLTVLAPDRLADRFDDYDSGLHRLYIWEFSAQRIAERPLLGWGLDAAPLIPGGEEKLEHGGNRMNVHPHNAFLQIWLELGAIGVALTAVILALLTRRIARLADPFDAVCAGGLLVSVLVVANLSFGIWQTWWMAVLALAGISITATGRIKAAEDRIGRSVNDM